MKTEKEIYKLFTAYLKYLFKCAGIRMKTSYSMASVTLKELERRSDGILTPKDPDLPTYVMEFQAQMDTDIYHRVAVEMASYALMHKGCDIRGIVVFLHKGLDPETYPWHYLTNSKKKLLQIVYLDEYINNLEQKQPDHPFVIVFKPLLEKDLNVLKLNSSKWYKKIKQSRLPEGAKLNFLDVFVRWLSVRFPELSGEEIIQMIENLPRFEETKAYELFSIYEKRGEKRGQKRGEKRGQKRGEKCGEKRGEKRGAMKGQQDAFIKAIRRYKLMNKNGEIDDLTLHKICEPIKKDLKKISRDIREMLKRQKQEKQ